MVSTLLRPRQLVCLTIFIGTSSVLSDTSIKHRLHMGGNSLVGSVAFSPDGEQLAVSCVSTPAPGEIRLYSVSKGNLVATLKGHKTWAHRMAFTPDGKLLLSGGQDSRCLIWNTATYELAGALNGHTEEIIDLSISPDGTQVATSSFQFPGERGHRSISAVVDRD